MNAVVFLSPGGQHQHRCAADFPDFPHGGEAVQLRHHHVHDNQVKAPGIFAANCNRLHAVLSLRYGESLERGVLADHHADFGFVINNQKLIHEYSSFPVRTSNLFIAWQCDRHVKRQRKSPGPVSVKLPKAVGMLL